MMTFDMVAGAAIFITSLIAAITGALTLREKVRAAGKPFSDEHRGLLNDVNELKTVNYHQMRAICVMLRHMIDGNDIDALKAELTILTQIIKMDDESHKINL